jgi:hypothetical protein
LRLEDAGFHEDKRAAADSLLAGEGHDDLSSVAEDVFRLRQLDVVLFFEAEEF